MVNSQVVVDQQVQNVLDALKGRTINHVYFVACGGSSAIMYPNKYILDREAKDLTSDVYSSNEFIHRNPRKLGENSLVVLCSMSGTTPETVKAAEFARQKGALTVGFTNQPTSPLAQESEFVVKYEWGAESVAFNTNLGLLYQLTFGVLNVLEGNDKFDKMVNSLSNLQSVFEKAAKQYEGKALQFGQEYKDEKVIYTMASGANYGIAYSYAICILMEMQWIHSNAVHSGEYFHGPFEIIDKDVPFIILLGLDETRPLDERALDFSKKYGEKLVVLDAKDLDLTGVDEELRGYIAPLVLNHVLRKYAEQLAEARNHPLSQRRYMWKVEY
ncbi:SIS domain-containing protein [Neobacillus cucumis]|uniref:Fructosamine deglycase n=1 Tax=Bacillus salipaludis TaxID=2547811 RepID=A0A4R5VX75_9BACI|nr:MULTISPECIES: SIS domain-containing protein [Bacillaceae]MBI0578104.1 SIS domain-containing protein [Neobacillus cucumis]MDQ6595158.1 SIS domain-containing protein [Bacillus salipaludis]TDK63985.1 SIS domain-containing protein [Bacillus salipaludis]WHY91816.1 SIS domain-containing protein [Neobacillus cucumis]